MSESVTAPLVAISAMKLNASTIALRAHGSLLPCSAICKML